MTRIELPWPDSRLSSNARVHHMTRHRLAKAQRVRAGWLALETPVTLPGAGDIAMRITFMPPSRRIDRQNMPHLIKSAIDGLADGWKVNDRRFVPEYVYADPVRGGRVVVEVLP